jgi:hypothetical protein
MIVSFSQTAQSRRPAMSDQDPFRQPDPLLRDRVGSRWIILFAVAVVVLLAAVFYGASREPRGTQTAGMSSDQAPRAASGTTHQGVPQSGDRATSTGPAGELNAPPSRTAPANPVQNESAAPPKP